MINFCLSEEEKTTLKSLIGKKLIKMRHDSFEKFDGETVYGKIELFLKDSIVLLNYDYAPYQLFGSKDDDHPKFSIEYIKEEEAVSALQDTEQINVKFDDVIKGITLVEDYSEVEWDGKNDNVRILTAIIIKFKTNEVAIQGDYMIPLLDILKGNSVEQRLDAPGNEFDNDPDTKFKTQRFYIEL